LHTPASNSLSSGVLHIDWLSINELLICVGGFDYLQLNPRLTLIVSRRNNYWLMSQLKDFIIIICIRSLRRCFSTPVLFIYWYKIIYMYSYLMYTCFYLYIKYIICTYINIQIIYVHQFFYLADWLLQNYWCIMILVCCV